MSKLSHRIPMSVKIVARCAHECQNGRTVNSRIYAYMHAYGRICTHIRVYAYIYAQQRAATEPKRPSPGVSHIGGTRGNTYIYTYIYEYILAGPLGQAVLDPPVGPRRVRSSWEGEHRYPKTKPRTPCPKRVQKDPQE